MSASLKGKLEKLAESRNRSASNLLETLIKEEVAKAEKQGEIDA